MLRLSIACLALALSQGVAVRQGYGASFDNPADFSAAISPSPSIVIDFDGKTVEGLIISSGDTFQGVTFTYSIFNLELMITRAIPAAVKSNYLGLNDPGNFDQFVAGDAFSLSFPVPIFALGLYYITSDLLFPGDIQLTTAGGGATNGPSPLRTLPQGAGYLYFVGFVSPVAFQTADLGASPAATGTFLFNVDDITYVPTPEPLSGSLIGVALITMVGSRHVSLARQVSASKENHK